MTVRIEKAELRNTMREERRRHVAALDDTTRALLFRHPPAPLLDLIPDGAPIGLYRAMPHEAPTSHYARYFIERNHPLALPRFANRSVPLQFAKHSDPFGESDLAVGPFGILQPDDGAAILEPTVLFVPLLAFMADGRRLGQGGGHYDRWLADHSDALAIGMAWDCQLVDELPIEEHDRTLHAVITPTRLFGPFA